MTELHQLPEGQCWICGAFHPKSAPHRPGEVHRLTRALAEIWDRDIKFAESGVTVLRNIARRTLAESNQADLTEPTSDERREDGD